MRLFIPGPTLINDRLFDKYIKDGEFYDPQVKKSYRLLIINDIQAICIFEDMTAVNINPYSEETINENLENGSWVLHNNVYGGS
jgi:hypothetical protein